MRYTNATPPPVSNETISSYMLTKHMVSKPDILPGVTKLWRNDITPLSSALADRGMFTKAMSTGHSDSNYKVVSQNHVQYAIESSDMQVVRIVDGPDGVPFKCDDYPDQPGKSQSVITIYVDTNYLSPKDVFEFGDGDTLGWIHDERLPEETTNGSWAIRFKVVAKSLESFIDKDMLHAGAEIGYAMTAFEHDFSETAYEKYTFDGWGHAFMTLQRMKYSYSGYAESMKADTRWVQANGGAMSFITKADEIMMRRWARSQEFANFFGKGTVSADNFEVITKDSRNRDVMIGDGVLHQGDGAYMYPIFEWTEALLNNMLSDIRIKSGQNGKVEVLASLGIASMNSFTKLMRKLRIQSQSDVVWEATAEGAGLKETYSYYEYNGVRLIPQYNPYFSHPDRPKIREADGTIRSHWEGILISLANTDKGDKGIELITLKDRFKTGTVDGINKGGQMATSIDGSSHHILFQSGIVNRNQDGIARMYRPVRKIRA